MKIASLILLCAVAVPLRSQEITVAAAADLHSSLDEIAAQFQSSHAGEVKVVYGASGNLFQQLQNGAPFDIFLSANADYPKKLEADGLTLSGTYYEYARGKIVLLVPATSTLDLKRGIKVLLDHSIKKIAIADPGRAPYGQAAVAALKSQNLYETVSPKLVTGENISQAASFVLSGGADIGIISMSLAISPSSKSQARFVEIPANEYPPIQQACVILKSSKEQKLARAFEAYLQGTEASKTLQRYGFDVPSH